MKTKAITHPPRQTLVIIREDYLAICDGDHCAAAIMNIFEYWNDHKEANREQAAIENKIAAEGNAPAVNDELWIYKSIPELKVELLGLFGDTKISNALDLIKSKGLLDSRNNPKYGWDRTLQYQLNVKVTQALILRHGTSRKNKASQALKIPHQSRKNKAAIPKTTTETTTKNNSDPVSLFIKAWLDGQLVQPITNQFGNKTNRAIAEAMHEKQIPTEHVTQYVKALANEPYWKGKLIPLTYVGNNIAAWIANKPAAAPVNPAHVPFPAETEPTEEDGEMPQAVKDAILALSKKMNESDEAIYGNRTIPTAA